MIQSGACDFSVCRRKGVDIDFNSAKNMFAELMLEARNIVVLTGAGISAESGIPTFRGKGGLWRQFRAQDLATVESFRKNPSLVWEFYHYRRELVSRCSPNQGHFSLASLEQKLKSEGKNMSLITQNIDRLHQAAGSTNVIEMHGSLWLVKSVHEETFLEAPGRVWENRDCPICPALQRKGDSSALMQKTIPISTEELPHYNGDLLRPAVVWFGENLDPVVLKKCFDSLEVCDLFIVIGTSSQVYPAAMFAPFLAEKGIPVVEVNLELTSSSKLCDISFQGKAGEILPSILL